MKNFETQEKIIDIIVQDILTNVVETDLRENKNLYVLGLDSLKLMKFIDRLEGCFKLTIDDNLIFPENFSSLSKVSDLILKCLSITAEQ